VAERRLTAQQAPVDALDYAGFPSQSLPSGGAWFRTHRLRVPSSDRGAWYFSSSPPEAPAPESGRFDLPAPSGTCYLASTVEAAVRELTHPFYVKNGWVPAPLIRGRVVSELGLPQGCIAADVTNADAASFRVSAELTTMSDYAVTQAWARAFHAVGFGAVLAALRFSPGHDRGLALFGGSGVPHPGWSVDTAPIPVVEVTEAMDIPRVDAPHRDEVELAEPDADQLAHAMREAGRLPR
jgi:hypothetical protein